MPVRIVEDVSAGRLPWQRLSRFFLSLIGIVLVLVGLLAAVYPVLLVVIIVDTVVREGHLPELTGGDWVSSAVIAGVAVLAVWLGVLLVRGRRSLGLYLRKFGFADTTRTVSQALRSAVGRSVRLVTLDDSQVAPIGVGAGRWIAPVVRIVAVVLVAWLAFYLFGGSFDSDSDRIINDTLDQAGDYAGDSVGDQFGAVIVGSMVGGVIAGMLLLFTMVALILAALVASFSYRAHRSARLAQKEASQALAQRQQVSVVANKLARVARKVFAPRLMVVTVPGSFWQEAVSGFAAVSKVAIVDVSHPTDPLLWEVGSLKQRFGGKLVFVGARDHVVQLARPAHEIAGTPHGLLAQLLDGEEIIAYGPTDSDRRRFTHALRRRIANVRAA